MAVFILEELYDTAKHKVSVLAQESNRLLYSCSSGVQRLASEDTDWDAPLLIELRGADLRGRAAQKWHQFLGLYKLENRDVNGKPAWRHAERSDFWLAFDGVGWAAQPEERLGDRFGWLQLRDTRPPHLSRAMWQAAPDDGSRWLDLPSLKCHLGSAASAAARRPGAALRDGGRDALCRPGEPHDEPTCEPRQSTASWHEGAARGGLATASGPDKPPSLPKPAARYIDKARAHAEHVAE